MKNHFPNYDFVLKDQNEEQKIFKDFAQKLIEFQGYSICDFFANMDVLQIHGNKSKQDIFAIYFGGRLVGTIYLGDLYSENDLIIIKKKFVPPKWEEICQYAIKTSEVWYHKLEQQHYAWIYKKVLKEV